MMTHVGTHTSIAGGLHLAFERSHAVGGDTLQIFAKSPRGWKMPEYTEQDFEIAREYRQKYGQKGGLIHSNYLANLAKPVEEAKVDVASILQDFEVAQATGFDAVNIHVGKQKGRANIQEAMDNMVRNVEIIFEFLKKKNISTVFVFENTAGQGSEIGSNLEELTLFYTKYLKDFPVKLCVDTAHCQGGGINVHHRDQFVEDFDTHIGIEKLYSIHLNDAKVVLGSHLDRHAPLGRGMIGRAGLTHVIKRANKQGFNLYIETPMPELRQEEIAHVRQIIAGDEKRIPAFHEKYFQTEVLKKFDGVKVEGLF